MGRNVRDLVTSDDNFSPLRKRNSLCHALLIFKLSMEEELARFGTKYDDLRRSLVLLVLTDESDFPHHFLMHFSSRNRDTIDGQFAFINVERSQRPLS